ncbi:unnamed protein product [Thlaspi arvense]|uniref:Alpha/beta hydrolase fold-3 domain-containing protein n=1 Tax=Thlaspi arvense TaxID=13288 RepID=A0AAU9S2M9_THLAR|nr:unnamed protein product [Thlaspi arvense]
MSFFLGGEGAVLIKQVLEAIDTVGGEQGSSGGESIRTGEPPLETAELDPILVVVGGSDLLKDRAEEYAEKLKGWGKKVEYAEFEGQQHGFFTIYPNSDAANELMLLIKRFLAQN